MITATSANANASGNHRSNHADKRSPHAASREPTDDWSSTFTGGDCINTCDLFGWARELGLYISRLMQRRGARSNNFLWELCALLTTKWNEHKKHKSEHKKHKKES